MRRAEKEKPISPRGKLKREPAEQGEAGARFLKGDGLVMRGFGRVLPTEWIRRALSLI